MNIFLADTIMLFHICVILFIILAPFVTNIPSILLLHICACITLLVHWWANNDICSLTIIEGMLRGVDRKESFTHQFIGPLYNISSTEWNSICKVITISVMLLSVYKIYKIYNSDAWIKSWECFMKLDANVDFKTKLKCFNKLFRMDVVN